MKDIIKNIRKNIIEISAKNSSSHLGCCLSVVDILSVLYFDILNIDVQDPVNETRDRMILSKGHAALALYSVLCEKGFFNKEQLEQYYQDQGLAGHPCIGTLPGIETSTGSLGHGLGIGLGMAIGAKIDKKAYHTFVVVGDGECNEGSVWEAVMLAGHMKLDNLTLVIDKNNCQGMDVCKDILDIKNIKGTFENFGWKAVEIDGHCLTELKSELSDKDANAPKVIIANTVHGKGVSFIEGKVDWHYKSMTQDQMLDAIKELDKE